VNPSLGLDNRIHAADGLELHHLTLAFVRWYIQIAAFSKSQPV